MPVVRESGTARGCWARKGEEQSRLRRGVSKRRAQRRIAAAVAGEGVAAACPRISAMAPARESRGARGCVARRERAAADLTPPPSAATALQRRHVAEVNQKVDDALPLAAELLVDVDVVFFPAMCRRGTARRESPMARYSVHLAAVAWSKPFRGFATLSGRYVNPLLTAAAVRISRLNESHLATDSMVIPQDLDLDAQPGGELGFLFLYTDSIAS
uniref:Uncharacterized protein n=2 Tax=Aegilops tauschii TaxID=37682 RepID=A0A452Z0C0_AEGTS